MAAPAASADAQRATAAVTPPPVAEHRSSAAHPSTPSFDAVAAESYPSARAVATLRAAEFRRVTDNGVVYLDHAGATLYAESQVRRATDDLLGTVHGNPHSLGPASGATTARVDTVRESVLRHFGVTSEQYAVVFTSGATAGIKIVAECFAWRRCATCDDDGDGDGDGGGGGCRCSELMMTKTNHTSVVGMREYAARAGATVRVVPADAVAFEEGGTAGAALGSGDRDETDAHEAPCLFVYPAECNFSGERLPLAWIDNVATRGLSPAVTPRAEGDDPSTCVYKGCSSAHRGDGGARRRIGRRRWYVMVDAAKFAGTAPLDLSRYPAHFAVLSFYKMTGYPTGLGALLIRRDAAHLLRKPYFGGGTVESLVTDAPYHKLRRDISGRFEDGTVSFLSITSLQYGLDMLRKLGMARVSAHACRLAASLVVQLRALRHSAVDGDDASATPVCEIYAWRIRGSSADSDGGASSSGGAASSDGAARHASTPTTLTQGPVVALNLRLRDGQYVGASEVSRLATARGIQVRTGCFCNVGACHSHMGLSLEDVMRQRDAGHVCWDDVDIVDGKPTGAVRVSFGYMSDDSDVEAFVGFVKEFFVEKPPVSDGDAAVRAHDETDPGAPKLGAASSATRAVETTTSGAGSSSVTLSSIVVYPIKSCSGMVVRAWPIGPFGLLYDREWCVVDTSGTGLSQKLCPELARVSPVVDLDAGTLTLAADGHLPFELAVGGTEADDAPKWVDAFAPDEHPTMITVCGEECSAVAVTAVSGAVHGTPAAGTAAPRGSIGSESLDSWLSDVIGRPVHLVRSTSAGRPLREQRGQYSSGEPDAAGTPRSDAPSEAPEAAAGRTIGFSNEGQFLLVSEDSVAALQTRVAARSRDPAVRRRAARRRADDDGSEDPSAPTEVTAHFFRPNLIVSGAPAFDEDAWGSVSVGGVAFDATGSCARCQMINIDQDTGKSRRSGEPLLTLAKFRRQRGRILFGRFLASSACAEAAPPGVLEAASGRGASNEAARQVLRVGDAVTVTQRVEPECT